VGIRFLMIAVFALALSGCATTSKTSPVNQLQVQVTEMQQRMEDQEKEIVDLKYEVKEMAGKSADQEAEAAGDESKAPAVVKVGTVKAAESKNLDIIRVGVSGRELQKALKAAGVYEGKVDGKVGAMTKAAVVEFQKAHSLKADGVVGQKTWNELKAYLNPPAEAATPASPKE
jgi:peptidoglycan hydrolase-like protein with peptidoglycan-binding domain